MKKTLVKKINGFTLLEVLVSIFILFIVTSASTAVVSRALSTTSNIKSKLIASELSQEGLELIRNIRDANWIENKDNPTAWDYGLEQGDWETDYQSQLLAYVGRYFKINSSGFYNYAVGDDTKFVRKITIQKKSDSQLRVISEISWTEKGRSNYFTAIEDLYNWYAE